ncbi:hypothetical protein VIBHAR_05407 [Vibrio campbellii ATCC BAA-1116]|uniref:Uncharacterized protein n=1 Tax=Vibrio campbellii (strain ATCC BAA-1116) TaxID=2902295 RepID=A7N3U4_VIBC1|nr:hypothetical protein VIBHAR_05407 [Vibrio campbellii ATCC BAA-1116]
MIPIVVTNDSLTGIGIKFKNSFAVVAADGVILRLRLGEENLVLAMI